MTIKIERNKGAGMWRYTATFRDGSQHNANSISGLMKKIKEELERIDLEGRL